MESYDVLSIKGKEVEVPTHQMMKAAHIPCPGETQLEITYVFLNGEK